ncbi:MAG: FAD-dependent monooxygenase [Betaproteobacteria bacterium]|nr:FAD-dependent monooxygenase [Betaproteobacteria bacterium]
MLVIGAGPVGATFALLAARLGLPATLLDARTGATRESRTLALSYGSRALLERVGAWADCASRAADIHRIHTSQQGAFGRVLIDRTDVGLPALGHVLAYADLQDALDAALVRAGVEVRFGARIAAIADDAAHATVTLEDGGTLSASAAVLADGGANLSKLPRFATQEKDYAQSALLAHVTCDRAHGHTAYERFTPEGPAALLPAMDAQTYSMVWVSSHPRIDELMDLGEPAFLAAFQQHFGHRAGRFLSASGRKRFPLRLRTVQPRASGRIAVIGNAAQALHPVAGQGFNLGLRDALMLAEAIAATPGDAVRALAGYADARAGDVERSIGFTDLLVGLFGNDHAPTRLVRGAGLLALDALPLARRLLAARMSFGAPR